MSEKTSGRWWAPLAAVAVLVAGTGLEASVNYLEDWRVGIGLAVVGAAVAFLLGHLIELRVQRHKLLARQRLALFDTATRRRLNRRAVVDTVESGDLATLLDAWVGAVPFEHSRDNEVRRIADWCVGADGSRIWLVEGRAGTGKTRLLLQLAQLLECRRARCAWAGGRDAVSVAAEKGGAWNILVDDADASITDIVELLTAIRLQGAESSIKLVVSARHFGTWWADALDEAGGDDARFLIDLLSDEATTIGALGTTIAAQQLVAERAVRAYSDPGRRRPASVSFTGVTASTPVALIHAAAVVAARLRIEAKRRRVDVDVSEAVEVLLDTETMNRWLPVARKLGVSASAETLRAALAITALLGAETKGTAVALMRYLPELSTTSRDQLVRLVTFVRTVYPRAVGYWVRPVLVGWINDYLIVNTLATMPSAAVAVGRRASQDGPTYVETLEWLAGRAVDQPGAGAAFAAVVTAATEQDGVDRLVIAVEVVAKTRAAQLDLATAACLDRAVVDSVALDRMLNLRPEDTDSFPAVALSITRHQLGACPEASMPAVMTVLARWQRRLGHVAEAVTTARTAVRLVREQEVRRPTAADSLLATALVELGCCLLAGRDDNQARHTFTEVGLLTAKEESNPDRARALTGLGSSLWSLGRHDEALAARRESVDLCRRLVATHSDAYTPNLAWALTGLGVSLWSLGRHDEALAAYRESVDLCRRLVATHPDAHTPSLAQALNNLGGSLPSLGRHDEALAANRESAELYGTLAATHPDAHTPNFAQALNNLGSSLSSLGRHDEALAANRESAELYGTLAATHPDAHTPDLAQALNNLGSSLSSLGHHDEALAARCESVELYRTLAATHSDAHTPNLAQALTGLGGSLSSLGQHDEALAARCESVELYRTLVATHSDAHTPNLAQALTGLGGSLSSLGQHDEALAAHRESVELRRTLAATHPDAHILNLAQALNNLGVSLSSLGQHDDEFAAYRESVELCRTLAATHPDAHTPNLALALNNLGSSMSSLEHHDEALAAHRESVDLYRTLAATHPDAHTPDLAMGLINLGVSLWSLGRHDEALAARRESVDLCRRLVATHSDAYTPNLAWALTGLGVSLWSLGRHDEALAAYRESVDLCRRLVATHPDAHTPSLAQALNNLGGSLPSLGRHDEALAANRESAELYGTLAATHPDAHLEPLAASLDALSRLLVKCNLEVEALSVQQECVRKYEILSGLDPTRYRGRYNTAQARASTMAKQLSQ